MTERLIWAFQQPIIADSSKLPYEVDITRVANREYLEQLVVNNCWIAQRYLVSGYNHRENIPWHKEIIRFQNHRHAIEFKLRIEY